MKSKLHIDRHGTKRWKLPSGKFHREDDPAIEAMHYESWWLNGKLHREDGPAIEWFGCFKEWYLNGKNYTHQEYTKRLRLKKLKHIL